MYYLDQFPLMDSSCPNVESLQSGDEEVNGALEHDHVISDNLNDDCPPQVRNLVNGFYT